ncbi:MAG: 3-dehydroquinate synthase [Alistipes sp.]|nr:3-dehydroquinate synthase [Alistipes sp.]
MAKSIEVTSNSTIYMGSVEVLLPQLLPNRRTIVISDSNIDRTHHNLINSYEHILIGQGEQAKSLTTLEEVYRRLIEMGADRTTFILGIGGGIVTDIAGFIASTYMRGLEFGFVTTTLLGAVDASVGGKNGVNVGGFKNMVGTFSQPKFVICDVALLHSLPEREFRAGLAEVIKTAILGDSELFEILEHTSCKELRKNDNLLEEIILRSMKVKASVVAEDEREGGRRRVLNLGHTLAHAIEKCSHDYSHGEAVAIGLHRITLSALEQKTISESEGKRILSLIEKYGFKTAISTERKLLLRAIEGDKKRKGNSIHIILPTHIGEVEDREVRLSNIGDIFKTI